MRKSIKTHKKSKEIKPPSLVTEGRCNQCANVLELISWTFVTGNSVTSLVCTNTKCPNYALLQVPEHIMYKHWLKQEHEENRLIEKYL